MIEVELYSMMIPIDIPNHQYADQTNNSHAFYNVISCNAIN